MLDLSHTILVGIGSTKVQETIKAIYHCQKLAKFHDTLYLTDSQISENTIRHIPIRNIPSKENYQKFIVNESAQILLSSISKKFNGHFLCINWDGFIVNPHSWTDEFLEYDYIGAPWPWFNHKVGNGGFCLKSQKFLQIQANTCANFSVLNNEDVELSLRLRPMFESYGCKYASSNIGYKFSTEIGDIEKNKSFGFHDFKYHPNYIDII